jgi:hypothetical protein
MENFKFQIAKEVTEEISLPKYFRINDSRFYMILDESRMVEVIHYQSKLIDFMTTSVREDLIRYYLASFARNIKDIHQISELEFKDIFAQAYVALLEIAN